MVRNSAGLLLVSLSFFAAQTASALDQRVVWREPHKIELEAKTQHRFIVDACAEMRIEVLQDDGVFLGDNLADPVDVVLINPSGERIPFKSTLEALDAGEDGITLPISFSVVMQPAPGEWQVQLLSRISQEAAVYYTLTVELIDPVYRFEILSEGGKRMVRRAMRIQAGLTYNGAPVSGVSVMATILEEQAEAGRASQLVLREGGEAGSEQGEDGVYEATFVPESPGSYTVHFSATDDEFFQRVDTFRFQAVAQGIELLSLAEENLIDAQDNGIADALELTVEVEVIDTDEPYALTAQLFDAEDRIVGAVAQAPDTSSAAEQEQSPSLQAHARHAEIPREKGLHRVDFTFAAAEIRAGRNVGPYRLELVAAQGETFPDADADAETETDAVRAAFKTRGYHWQDFEPQD